MKKQFFNLGKALNKAEQKLINGGIRNPTYCVSDSDCDSMSECNHRRCRIKLPTNGLVQVGDN